MSAEPGAAEPDRADAARPPRRQAVASALAGTLAPMQAWSLWAVLLAALIVGFVTVRAPAPVPATAPSQEFSALRAFRDVQVIGRRAHPTGSPEAAQVRRYVYDRLAAMGLNPQMRTGLAIDLRRGDASQAAAAEVQNIVATLPGSDPTLPAVLIMAHSDSVANSPGAADDGAGVATLLETARSLAGDPPHPRGVIFAVTDGEEAGLLGARAFFADDPDARRVGAVLNMDTRGDAGRAAMFQLGPRSGGLLDLYRQDARAPFANSLTGLLFRILPNDTDFTIAVGKDLPGLNFAFIGDQLAYHTPLATPEHLSKSSLQSMGGQVLPVARALAETPGPLPDAGAPAAYADLFGATLLALPFWSGALLWIVAGALAGYAAWRAEAQGLARSLDMLRGAGVALLATLSAALALQAAGALLGSGVLRVYALVGRYDLLFAGCALLTLACVLGVLAISARGQGWRRFIAGVVLVALLTQVQGFAAAPLVLALVTAGLGWAVLRRPCGSWATWLGALGLGVALAGLLQAAAPGAGPLVLFPTFLGALAAAFVFGLGTGERVGRVALALAGGLAVLALGWLCGWASGLFSAAGPFLPMVLAPFPLLALIVAAPFARLWAALPWAPHATAAFALAGGLALAWTGLAPPTADRPRLTAAYVVRPVAGGPILKVAPFPGLDPWTRALLPNPRRLDLAPLFARPVWTAPASSRVRTPAPGVDVLRVQDRIVAHIGPDGGARRLTVWVRSATPLAEPLLDARPFAWALTPNRWSRLDFNAPPPEGFTLSLAAGPDAEIEVVAAQLVDGWPAGEPLPRKPPGYMAFGDSETTLGVSRVKGRPQAREIPNVPPEALRPTPTEGSLAGDAPRL